MSQTGCLRSLTAWIGCSSKLQYTLDDKEGANTKDMMPPNNTTFPTINKSPSHYVCCKCTTKPADYYVLTGNPKAPSEMIPLCDACYNNQSGRWGEGKNTRTWYYHQHPRNGEVHTMLAAYVDTTPITYVLEALPQSAQIVKPAMLESLGMKLLK